MKRIVKLSSLFFLTLLFSCFEKDVYPDVPKIEFSDIVFYDGEFADSLVLSFGFEDGNGNIGLSNGVPPFHIFDGIADSTGRFVLYSTPPDTLEPPFFAIPIEARSTIDGVQYFQYPSLSRFYSFDDERTSYNCDDYFIIESDTFFVNRNVYNKNIYIEFEKKVGGVSGDSFERFELPAADCESVTFDARIPIFESGAQKGVIKYNIQSIFFRQTFLDDIIRIKFWIYDRALNQSNIEYTEEFTLAEITQ